MNTNLVIDTSVIVKYLNKVNEANIDKADDIIKLGIRGDVSILVPELVKYEIGNVLLHGKRLTYKEASISLDAFYSLPLEFIPDSEKLSKKTFDVAYKYGITYYDASFLVIAKEYNATLITENFKHQGRVKDIQVTALKDYQK